MIKYLTLLTVLLPATMLGQCFKYVSVPTKLDTSYATIPAVIQYTPAVYKDVVKTITIKPEYEEQYMKCDSVGSFFLCTRKVPAVKLNITEKEIVIPAQEVIIKPACKIPVYTVVEAGKVKQVAVPCE